MNIIGMLAVKIEMIFFMGDLHDGEWNEFQFGFSLMVIVIVWHGQYHVHNAEQGEYKACMKETKYQAQCGDWKPMSIPRNCSERS